MDPPFPDITFVKSNIDIETRPCFFCLGTNPKLGQNPVVAEDIELSNEPVSNVNLPPLPSPSLRLICRYLNVLIINGSNSNNGSKVFLCEPCAKVRSTLSELIQLKEVTEMKISYWLEVLQRLLLADDNVGDQNAGGENNAEMDLLREALKMKCSSIVNSNIRQPRPCIPVKKPDLQKAQIVIPKDNTKTEPEAGPSSSTSLYPGSPGLFQDLPGSCWSPAVSASANTSFFAPGSPNHFDDDANVEMGSSGQQSNNANITVNIENSEALKRNPTRRRQRHHKPKAFQCDICGNTFSYRETLKTHLKTVHHKTDIRPKFGPQKCQICDATFQGLPNLQTHFQQVHQIPQQAAPAPGSSLKKWKCDWSECGKLLSTKKSLIRHIETKHKNKYHECPRCHRKFSRWGRKELMLHQRLNNCQIKDLEQRKHICEICGKRYFCRESLYAHKTQVHSEKEFSCAHCGEKFSLKSRYNKHVQSHSADKAVFICQEADCGKAYKYQAGLQTHMRKMHGIGNPKIPEVPTGNKPECPHCRKIFQHRSTLRKHLLLQSCKKEAEKGENKCGICNKRFPTKLKLSRHTIWVHEKKRKRGKSDYRCEETNCGKIFKDRNNLRLHRVLHHGFSSPTSGNSAPNTVIKQESGELEESE